MRNEAKALEREIYEWRRLGAKKGIWLFIATIGCNGIPAEDWWLRCAAMIITGIIILHELYDIILKFNRTQSFQESLYYLKDEIIRTDYERIAKLLTLGAIVKQTYPMLLATLFYVFSFWYFL